MSKPNMVSTQMYTVYTWLAFRYQGQVLLLQMIISQVLPAVTNDFLFHQQPLGTLDEEHQASKRMEERRDHEKSPSIKQPRDRVPA